MELKNKQVVELDNVKTIGVIMFGLLGDVFMRTPVLKALKQLYPTARIFVCTDPVGKLVLHNNPYCNETIVTNRSKKNKLQYYVEKVKVVLEIRKRNPDLMIDLYNGGSSPMTVFLSSARYRLGFAHQKDKRLYNILSSYVPYKDGSIDSYNTQSLAILEPITKKNFSNEPIFALNISSESVVDNLFETYKVDMNKTYTINLGSGGVEKLLPLEVYAELIQYIFQKYGYLPLIIRNPGQEYLQEQLSETLKLKEIKYVALCMLSLDELAFVIKRSLFFITPDTGLMHLAFSLKVYVLTPFEYTNPKLVDIDNEKFFAVFDSFDNNEIFKKQNIDLLMMQKNLDLMVEMMKENDCMS